MDKNFIKRRMKQYYELWKILMFSTFGLFVVIIATTIFIINHPEDPLSIEINSNSVTRITYTICISIMMLATAITGFYAQGLGYRLRDYKKKIITFRRRSQLHYVIKLMDNKDYKTAVNFYNRMDKSDIKDFLYAYLLGVFKTCDVPERVEIATKTLQTDVLDVSKPEDVFNN